MRLIIGFLMYLVYAYKTTNCTGTGVDRKKVSGPSSVGEDTTGYRSIKAFEP